MGVGEERRTLQTSLGKGQCRPSECDTRCSLSSQPCPSLPRSPASPRTCCLVSPKGSKIYCDTSLENQGPLETLHRGCGMWHVECGMLTMAPVCRDTFKPGRKVAEAAAGCRCPWHSEVPPARTHLRERVLLLSDLFYRLT